MTFVKKGALFGLCGLLLTPVAAYLPALHPIHWVLRVGVREAGLLLVLGALPLAYLIRRSHARASVLIFSLLSGLVLVPWSLAIGPAQRLQTEFASEFTKVPSRTPFLMGERGEHRVVTEEYAPGQEWDRYRPTRGQPKARLIFVHGGSWRNGSKSDYPGLFAYLADRGYEVCSISYTLSGTAPYPAASNDVAAAIERAAKDEIPLFVGGRSSGGHLALLGAYSNPGLVKGVIAFYPPTDMIWSYEHPSNPNILDSNEAILQFMGAPPEAAPKKYEEASPLARATGSGPPTLLIHGRADSLVYHRQSERLVEKLDELGISNYLLSLPWMEHGGDIILKGPTGRLSVWAIEGFMESLR